VDPFDKINKDLLTLLQIAFRFNEVPDVR